MGILLALLSFGLIFYFVSRLHGQMGGCGGGHEHKGSPPSADEGGAAAPGSAPPNPAGGGSGFGPWLALALLLLLPLMLAHIAVAAGTPLHWLLFWLGLLLPIAVFPVLWARRGPTREQMAARIEGEREAQEAEWARQRLQVVGPLGERVAREMEVEGTRYEGDLVIFEGRLRGDPEQAYARLAESFAEVGRTPRFLEGEGGRTVVVAVSRPEGETKLVRQNLLVPLLLFAATLITTTWAGALHQGVNLWQQPGRFAVGLPYALALMAILLIHELGHYVASRVHGIPVTLPYFIPIPMGLGTFGAFIQIRGAIPDRRKLFDVGVAGPLAGLVVALPALYVGLQGATASTGHGVSLSSSVLLAWLYDLAVGHPMGPDQLVALGPLAFAGWLGLQITALNLIPVGQLDGGHVAYALFGRRRAEILGWIGFFLLLALGIFYWSGWLTWAILIFFLGGAKHEPALNELPAPEWPRRALGALAFVLLFLIMAPVPHRFLTALGIACPYL